jgi:hypothetical protein
LPERRASAVASSSLAPRLLRPSLVLGAHGQRDQGVGAGAAGVRVVGGRRRGHRAGGLGLGGRLGEPVEPTEHPGLHRVRPRQQPGRRPVAG